jgi:hypothetical protein
MVHFFTNLIHIWEYVISTVTVLVCLFRKRCFGELHVLSGRSILKMAKI